MQICLFTINSIIILSIHVILIYILCHNITKVRFQTLRLKLDDETDDYEAPIGMTLSMRNNSTRNENMNISFQQQTFTFV